MPAAVVQPLPSSGPPLKSYAHAPVSTEPPVEHATLDHRVPPGQGEVPWDVVGLPRKADASAAIPSSRSEWSPSTDGAYGSLAYAPAGYAPAGYAPAGYASQHALSPYGAPVSTRTRVSGRTKFAIICATLIIGFAVRWAIGSFFGADLSVDGPITVTTPGSWTTYTVSNPDMTYAVDANWRDITNSSGIQLPGPEMRLIDVRSLPTEFTGDQAIMVIAASSARLPGAKVSRDEFTSGFDTTPDKLATVGAKVVSREKTTILKSAAGDRWGFSSAKASIEGVAFTVYDAVALIDDYLVEVELIVRDGVGLTENDILAVVNSIKAR